MNKLRRKNIQEVIDKLTSLQNDLESLESDVESIQDEEIEYRDNMPENLQGSERYEQADKCGDYGKQMYVPKYLGVVPNNASGRTSLWSDLVKIRTQLQELGAIEGFTDSDVTVAQGDSKKAVVITSAITVVNAMGKLYETVTVA